MNLKLYKGGRSGNLKAIACCQLGHDTDTMRTRRLICAVASGAALIGGAPALADPPNYISDVTVLGHKPHMVSGVTVRAGSKCFKARRPAETDIPPPKLVSSYPARGAEVRPGILVLRLTFDLPMTCEGLLDNHAPLVNPCPAPLHEPLRSFDRRTFLTVCKIDKSTHYGLWLNRDDQRRFTSLAGRSAAANELVFDTSAGPEITSIDEALAQDKWLREAMRPKTDAESRQSAAGESQ